VTAPTPTPEETAAAEAEHDGPKPIVKDGVLYVGLKLAHPLSREDAVTCGALVKKNYNVGNIIRVGREWGMAMIEQGRVQVDPTDRKAVQSALLINKRNQPLTADEIAALFPEVEASDIDPEAEVPGAGDADASGPAQVEARQSAASAPAKAGKRS